MRTGTYSWTVYGIDVRVYLSPGPISYVAQAAKETRDQLQAGLAFHTVPEPEVQPARDGLKLVFTFRFKPDFLRFDPQKRQNELVSDPAKESLRDSLERLNFKPSRS